MKWIIGLLVGLFLIAGLARLGATPKAKEKAAAREMIERCRKAENDQLQELATRRLMRQGCDQMVKDYQAKWGVSP